MVGESTQDMHPRQLALAVLAVALVAGAAAAFIVLRPGPTTEHAADADPMGVVERWTAARNAGDTDAAMDLVADDGVVLNVMLSRPNGREQLRGILEAQRIADWHIEETGCHVEGPRVTCRYGMDDALLRRCALRFTGVHTYVVHGGRLARASRAHDWKSRNRVYAALDDFRDWVQREHPDAAETIWIDTRAALYTTADGARAVMALVDDYPCPTPGG